MFHTTKKRANSVLIGKTLKDRYRIYDRLGAGGAATVYLGRDSITGQMVIVKLVHANLVDEKFMGRFRREINLLQKIDNPYVINLYDWALQEHNEEGQELSYIVAEFVEGHTLADIVDTRGKLDEPAALAIARQIAQGLDDIHNRGIVHRDIKSQNIMITPLDEAKIIDFGIAKGEGDANLTATSHFAGTLYYAPPEQILEAVNVDHRADIYALGIVLYEMLTASLPVKAREFGTVASRIISGNLDPITGVSHPVEKLVNKMIAYKVENRHISSAEVIADIERIMGAGTIPALPDRPVPDTTSRMVPIGEIEASPTNNETIQEYELVATNGKSVRLTEAETVIGRSHPRDVSSPDIDLWMLDLEDARTASRRHCRILYQDGAFHVEDLGSMNGTRINGSVLESGQAYKLQEGDRLSAGRVELLFRHVE